MPSRVPTFRPVGYQSPADRARQYDSRHARREDIKWYQSPEWRALRISYLRANPLCERCEANARTTPASHVHHKIERKARPDLSLSWFNLESLCLPCHSSHHGFKVDR